LDSACVYAKNDLHQKVVKPEIINTVISQITHAPTLITAEMKNKLQQLETVLKTEIIGQEQAINQIIFGLKRAFISLGKRKKPLASFLFVGPTGVGKTQTAKIISEVVFGKDKEILRFDMANYQSKNDIANLIGSLENPTPGLLTQKIRQNPFAILLLDEIEKADKELLHIFLSLLDEGYFTDGWGKNVDGKNLIIIATSNAASKAQFKEEIITDNQLLAYLIDNNYFSPEFLNRFDGIIFFHHLPPNFIKEIIRKLAGKISWEIYHDHQVQVEISADLVEQIFQKQYSQNSQEFGARHLERAVREEIGNKIANLIFANKVKAGDKIII
jgi:ATP-dependent Clp protease ATP-binding subunit ClpB